MPHARSLKIALVLVAVSGAVGCQAPSRVAVNALQLLPVPGGDAVVGVAGKPSVLRTIPADGMAHVKANLTIRDVTPMRHTWQLLALPATWTTSVVTLHSPTANLAFAQAKNSLTIPFASYTSVAGPAYTATASFPAMRPAADYQGQVFLQNLAGTIATTRLAGSQTGTYTLNAGANTLTFTITVNGNEATYSVASSTANNAVTGNGFVAGDTVVLNTGFAANQPGVASVDVLLSGAAYGSPGAPVNIARLTTAASWNSYSWNSGANNAVAPANYTAATLSANAGTGTTAAAGQLDFQANDANGLLVGKSSMAIGVFGTPTITIKVQ